MNKENTVDELFNQYNKVLDALDETYHPDTAIRAEEIYLKLEGKSKENLDKEKSKLIQIITKYDPELAKEIFKRLSKREQTKPF